MFNRSKGSGLIMIKVSRKGLTIKAFPQSAFETGAIFQYTGSSDRLKGFVLIHEVDPVLDSISKRDGRTIRESSHVVAEVLIPENQFSDYCVFWIEKRSLKVPSREDFASIFRLVNEGKLTP